MKNTIWLIISLIVVAVLFRFTWQPSGGTTVEIPAPTVTASVSPSPLATPESAKTPDIAASPNPPLSELGIEGIGVGMTRAQVEAKLGKHDLEIFVSQSSNDIAFHTKSGKVLIGLGNHPAEQIEVHNPKFSGLFYEDLNVSLGYNGGKVAWVYGPRLTLVDTPVEGKLELANRGVGYDQYLLDNLLVNARQGYCMDGPWAFLGLNGHLEVLGRGSQFYGLFFQAQEDHIPVPDESGRYVTEREPIRP